MLVGHFIHAWSRIVCYRSECHGKGFSLPVFAVMINNTTNNTIPKINSLIPEQPSFPCLYNRAIHRSNLIFMCVLCVPLLVLFILLLILHWFVCNLIVCFLNRKWPNCKRTFVFRCSGLFLFQANIWFRKLKKTKTRHIWVTHLFCNLISGKI